MRFSNAAAAALLSSAALLGNAVADELDEKLGDAAESSTVSTVSTSTSTKEIVKPSFTALKPSPSESGKPFFEQFTPDWNERWKISNAKKENTEEEWAYVGQWEVEETNVLQAIKGDKYLVAKNKAAHHAISAKFDKPIDNTDKTLVVQYEVKLQDGLDCGGAYMKLLKENKELHADEFSNASPYVIMFGPDKCGSTNKVHFIFKHKNPLTGEYEEKHLKNPPAARMTRKTVLYTLIVKPDSYFEIRMDGERVKNGTLLEDFTPSVIPDKEIDDKDDTKPSDWVDQAMIADPEATKPEDWDEDAPYQIVDEDAVKPDDWLENEPETIADPESEKPDGWDDEEDGDWIAPQIPNPKCEEASGCGPWKRPMKDNPEYKGKWTAPMVSNPEYKGVWAPRKIANPDYFEDKQPSKFEPIGAIGFELWTMNSGISFDNIYIGHSIKDAENIQHKTFDIKNKIETEEEDSSAEKPDPYTKKDKEAPKSPMDISFKEDPVNYIKENLDLFITLVKRDPVEAVKFMPEFAATLGATALAILGLLVGLLSLLTSGSSTPAPARKPVVSKKTEVVEPPVVEVVEVIEEDETIGTTTGAEKIKATKRGTTSRKE